MPGDFGELAIRVVREFNALFGDGIAAAMGADGLNLQELARTAAMGAEKEAIQHALERFRWNRRKTAEYLQVSYKTLLNKMKECGIAEAKV